MTTIPTFSKFAENIRPETAFTVLAIAKELAANGKDIVELEIGDSPFTSPAAACETGGQVIGSGHVRYGPSIGLPEFRREAASYVSREYGLPVTAKNIVAGPGAKLFEQLFCEAFLNPGDGVLVFSPYFPTYFANIARRGARMVLSNLTQSRHFRPNLDDVSDFLENDPSPRAIFLNSPHNPTGGVATMEDLQALADLIRGKNIAVFSDEPYDRMVWQGQHHTLAALPGMLEQTVAAYSFSKSFSMGGWRLGFAATAPATAELLSKLTNTSVSCVPPFTQLAGIAAMQRGCGERDAQMEEFRRKIELLVRELNEIEGITCLVPGGTFYVFPSVAPICNRLGITSHGLAMYLLEGADENFGVACLGGECFGDAGSGFLRLSCAQSDDRLSAAVSFLGEAIQHSDRVERYVAANEQFRLQQPYPV